ncbi:hypothetical protein [Bradyrhizobium tunisiense]|uniref:hypothetical protein n=1 Tax=Bradyrhizobium tunisiense TaxID=3278709 RepID=UPI0035D7A022
MFDNAASSAAAGDGLWLTISDIAARKSVTKQTISERVNKLVAEHGLSTRPGKGKSKLVNLAEYDRLVGETTDLSRQQGADTKAADEAPAPARDGTFSKAQADRAGYEAELKRLDLEERLGKLLSIEDVTRSMERCAAVIVREIEQIPDHCDELFGAASKGGAPELRQALKDLVRKVRLSLEQNMRVLPAEDDRDAGDHS